MQLHVAIDAGGEPFVHVAHVGVERMKLLNGARVALAGEEVGFHAVAAEHATHLAAGAQETESNLGAVVLELDVGHRISGGGKILREDVRNAESGATDLHLTGELWSGCWATT